MPDADWTAEDRSSRGTAAWMRERRRVAILVFVAFASLVAPAGPLTVFAVAVPLALAYEAAIFVTTPPGGHHDA